MKKLSIIILFLAVGIFLPLKDLCAAGLIRIANVDNYVLHKYLSGGTYSKNLEAVLERGVVEDSIFGISWENKDQIDKISLAEKTIKEPEASEGYPYLSGKARINDVDYPYEKSGWTLVHMALNRAREIVLEIKGGVGEPVHQQVGNIGIKRPDGIIEDIPVRHIGIFSSQKRPVLVVSDHYFYVRKDRGEAKAFMDQNLDWKYGFQVLIVRRMLQEAPGGDRRFTVRAVSSEGREYNDTVLIRISLDKRKFAPGEIPTIILGWKTVEEIDEGGDLGRSLK